MDLKVLFYFRLRLGCRVGRSSDSSAAGPGAPSAARRRTHSGRTHRRPACSPAVRSEVLAQIAGGCQECLRGLAPQVPARSHDAVDPRVEKRLPTRRPQNLTAVGTRCDDSCEQSPVTGRHHRRVRTRCGRALTWMPHLHGAVRCAPGPTGHRASGISWACIGRERRPEVTQCQISPAVPDRTRTHGAGALRLPAAGRRSALLPPGR